MRPTLSGRARVVLLAATSLAATPPGGAAPAGLAATPPAAAPVGRTAAPAAGQHAAVVQQPRGFGYTVGDVATQRVLLARGGRDFTPAALPGAARVDAWLERRAVRIEAAADGQRWLAVDYQIVNAPRTLTAIALPAWELAGPAGAPALRVPATTLSVGPLTVAAAPGELPPLRPDRPAPAIDTAAIARQLGLWLLALAATVLAWAAYAGWKAWRDRSTLPFARALRDLRTAAAEPAAAHRALHHAFDRTAGRIVHAQRLEPLFERAPHLQPLRPDIERFYAQSAGLFFGAGLPAGALSPQALCRQLRRLERRHAP
jgi:mxaA protein